MRDSGIGIAYFIPAKLEVSICFNIHLCPSKSQKLWAMFGIHTIGIIGQKFITDRSMTAHYVTCYFGVSSSISNELSHFEILCQCQTALWVGYTQIQY